MQKLLSHLFDRNTQSLMGIDIGSAAIRVLELENQQMAGEYQVLHAAERRLPMELQEMTPEQACHTQREILEAMLQDMPSPPRQVAIAVGGPSVIVRRVPLEGVWISEEDEGIEEYISMEFENWIPAKLNEVYYDFKLVPAHDARMGMPDGSAEGTTEGDTELVLAIAPRDLVDRKIKLMGSLGCRVSVVDVTSTALMRASHWLIEQWPRNSNAMVTQSIADYVAVVDVGSFSSSLYLFHNEHIVYTRTLGCGGHQLWAEIERRYGISKEEARVLLQEKTLPAGCQEVIHDFQETLADQINRGLKLFTAGKETSMITHIMLVGGGALLQNLQDVVQIHCEIPTTVANPWSKFTDLSQNPGAIQADAPKWMLACGLALRKFDV